MRVYKSFFLAVALIVGGRADADVVSTYRYDALGRLTRVCDATPAEGQRATYALDPAGNRSRYEHLPTVIVLPAGSGISSPDGRFYFIMQSDGNLVQYGPTGPLWASGTNGTGGSVAILHPDGNLVIYRSDWVPIWQTATYPNPCANMNFQNDGNVVIYNTNDRPLWATNTGGH